MATNAEIQAAIAEAQSLRLKPQDMVDLLDRAIAAAFATGGSSEVVSVSYTVGGRSRTLALSEARGLRQYYASIAGGGGLIMTPIEFS